MLTTLLLLGLFGDVDVVEPEVGLLTLSEAKAHLRVTSNDEDDLIQGYIDAAIAHIDGPDGWLGRAITVQTLTHYACGFEDRRFRLPYPPVRSITTVAYLDSDGASQVTDPALYELTRDKVRLRHGASWPQALWREDSVVVTYEAGYDVLPKAVRAALLLMVGDLYRNRETATGGPASAIPMSTTVQALLGPFRVFSI